MKRLTTALLVSPALVAFLSWTPADKGPIWARELRTEQTNDKKTEAEQIKILEKLLDLAVKEYEKSKGQINILDKDVKRLNALVADRNLSLKKLELENKTSEKRFEELDALYKKDQQSWQQQLEQVGEVNKKLKASNDSISKSNASLRSDLFKVQNRRVYITFTQDNGGPWEYDLTVNHMGVWLDIPNLDKGSYKNPEGFDPQPENWAKQIRGIKIEVKDQPGLFGKGGKGGKKGREF